MKFYETPTWLTIPFLIGIAFVILLISICTIKNTPSTQKNKVLSWLLVFFISYVSYVIWASKIGLFSAAMFPPKILLFTTLPYALFIFLVVVKLPLVKIIIENTSLTDLIGLHIFRLVGATFIVLACYDSLPKFFGYLAGIGDVLTALTSLWVVFAIKNKKSYAHKIAFVWNVFGFVDILLTAVMANVLTKISIDTGQMGVDTLARYPFSLIPAIAPPTIILLHLLIFKKLKKN